MKFKNKIILLFLIILSFFQSTFAQYKINLISKKIEINFSKTEKRGIEQKNVIYYVEEDLQTISAYKNKKTIWQTNVISVCGKPKVGNPQIRYVQYNIDKLLIVIGKHNFAEVDIKNGKTKLVGSD